MRRVQSKFCLIISQADDDQDRREKSFFSGILESFEKKIYQIRSIGDRWGKVWLGSSGISSFWPSIVTGLSNRQYNTKTKYDTLRV